MLRKHQGTTAFAGKKNVPKRTRLRVEKLPLSTQEINSRNVTWKTTCPFNSGGLILDKFRNKKKIQKM